MLIVTYEEQAESIYWTVDRSEIWKRKTKGEESDGREYDEKGARQ